MDTLVSYRHEAGIATIAMADGKVNALSRAMLAQLGAALDRAEADRAAVVLTGRTGVFSAGFDLPTLRAGGPEAVALLRDGFALSARLLGFPAPVVIACSGHAIAMGAFVALSGDYRIGAAGSFKITANEVALGLPLPRAAIEICRQRLAPVYLTRALLLAEVFTPDEAVTAGFLDRVVPAGELAETAWAVAARLAALDRTAHAISKQRLRSPVLAELTAAMAELDIGFATGGFAAGGPTA
jgi:enoyl-CoA hydratase